MHILKWKKIKRCYLYEVDGKQYVTERYISRETFCFYNPLGGYKCKVICGYKCRKCGHYQMRKTKYCENCESHRVEEHKPIEGVMRKRL